MNLDVAGRQLQRGLGLFDRLVELAARGQRPRNAVAAACKTGFALPRAAILGIRFLEQARASEGVQ